MELNCNNEVGQCICSFSMETDRIWIFEVPDENRGFISGWIFLFNCTPYFYSIAGGSEDLNVYLANTYAEYLAEHGEFDLLEESMPKGEGWVLNDDLSMEFDAAFTDAMMDAGFKMRKDGGWKYVPKKTKKHKKRHKNGSKTR